ncbi:hypothetical protein EXU30_04985 [Shewanella maritima]|uniref:Uncharacterized protein n=1 Tax=Shewanella maritima TaxID=2520507 RepID=A0A411PFG5_9GAMM|nr:hypothetical protein [Shewanella maritima]QBF82130.1 hypothetical protein EXU30_04985 [Shewanella maritima]
MSDKTKQNMDDNAFAKLQDEIRSQYHQQDLEQPPKHIDAAILALASQSHQQVHSAAEAQMEADKKVVQLSWWSKNKLGISSAASVMLVAGLFLLNPELMQQGAKLPGVDANIPSEMQAEPMLMMSGAPSDEAIETAGDGRQSAAPLDNSGFEAMAEPSAQTASSSAAGTTASDMLATPKQRSLPTEALANGAKLLGTDQYEERVITLDTAEKALERLQGLVDADEISQARMLVEKIDKRFPELAQKSHPLFARYSELKQQLTSY